MNTVQTPYGEIDVSKLRVGDVANLALQRTDTLFDTGIPKIRSPSYLFWARFKIALPLKVEASLRWRGIVSEAMATISTEVEQIVACLGPSPVRKLCDIGCGYAFHDVLFCRLMELSHVHLIDIEQTSERHHDFNRKGAGYSDLSVAKALIECNTTAEAMPEITTLNPQREALDFGRSFDLILSLLSCGFHYPVDTYTPFFDRCLAEGGRIVLDLRKGEDHSTLFEGFQVERTIVEQDKSARVTLVRKSARARCS